jgi:hypothetical protein
MVDRIGKGGGPKLPDMTPTEGAKRTTEASRPFELGTEKASAARPAAEVGQAAEASPLARLRAGEIDVNRYMDLKVEEATSHLHGMRAQDLDAIKRTLRGHMESDPALADLVKQIAPPAPPRDE